MTSFSPAGAPAEAPGLALVLRLASWPPPQAASSVMESTTAEVERIAKASRREGAGGAPARRDYFEAAGPSTASATKAANMENHASRGRPGGGGGGRARVPRRRAARLLLSGGGARGRPDRRHRLRREGDEPLPAGDDGNGRGLRRLRRGRPAGRVPGQR